MATDATGAPTPLGIPKYNTSADAPSGLGFNAAMDALDALIAAKVGKPSGISAGEVPVWNGSTFVRSSTTRIVNGGSALPSITTSTLAGGPPGSPSDGDIWVATAVDGNGARWAFQYNAGSASAYKWEYIGGAPAKAAVGTDESTVTLSTWVDLATVGPSFTTSRDGDYMVEATANTYHTVAGTYTGFGVALGAAAAGPQSLFQANTASPGNGMDRYFKGRMDAVGVGASLRLRYWTAAATANFRSRVLYVTPVRVS